MYHSFYSSSNRFFRLGALNTLKYKDIHLIFFLLNVSVRWCLDLINLRKTMTCLVATAGFPTPFMAVHLYVPASVVLAFLMVNHWPSGFEALMISPTFVHVTKGRGFPSVIQLRCKSFPSVISYLLVVKLIEGASKYWNYNDITQNLMSTLKVDFAVKLVCRHSYLIYLSRLIAGRWMTRF